jgi:phosphoenolpyruvate phosphomutase
MHLLRHMPRFRRAYRELAELGQRETWSRAEIEAFQLERLGKVWRHAIKYVPYYRELRQQADLPDVFASLQEFRDTVPALSKAKVRSEPQRFVSERPSPGTWRRTGGSTGMPMSLYREWQAHWEMLRTQYRFYQAWEIDIFDRAVYLWGHSAALAPGIQGQIAKLRQPLEDWSRNRLRLSAYHLGRDDLRRYLESIHTFRPVSAYGYSHALYLLAAEAEAVGFNCDSLRLFVLTGEPAFPFIVERVERAFHVPAVVEYGATECGVIAAEWPDRRLHVREDNVLLETVPRDDGRHDIVISVLNNPSFPLLRYSLGDTTDAPVTLPEHGFAVLENVGGRNNDVIVTRSGDVVHSGRFEALFKYHTQGVRQFRVRQRADGSLTVTVEPAIAPEKFAVADLERKIGELVEGYPVSVELVDSIPQSGAGKHRLIISHLSPPSVRGAAAAAVPSNGEPSGEAVPPANRNGKSNGHGTPSVLLPEAAGRAEPALKLPRQDAVVGKALALRHLIERPQLSFLMESHNGLSAKIVEEAGFEGIWASGLAISASLGVRDCNEASWTQVLEILEFMNDSVQIPILVDGDTGYGNFNTMRRFVQKLEQRGIAGVCIEDKIFPKTNSFIRGTQQPLADREEFCGRIAAGCDARKSDDFVIVARVEALIAGWGLDEALSRAEAYRRAGADAILIHSAQRSADEVLAFKERWGDRLPVVIVPTRYYTTPTALFRERGFSTIIWANQLLRACIPQMQRTAQLIFEEQAVVSLEDGIAPLAEVFRLQGESELEEAEKRYLPRSVCAARAIVLAAARGAELAELTRDRPKCMVPLAGVPILEHVVDKYRAAGIKDIAVVRGYGKETVNLPGLTYYDNDEADCTGQAFSLYQALPALQGTCIISFGDVLFKKYIAIELMESDADFAVFVDVNWRETRNRGRSAHYVACSVDGVRRPPCGPVRLVNLSCDLDVDAIHGEWMGFLKVSSAGAAFLRGLLESLPVERLRKLSMAALIRQILEAGKEVRVIYTAGHWFDVDSVEDLMDGSQFQ